MPAPAATQQLLFRRTNAHRGRRVVVTPENSPMRRLRYARILLESGTPPAAFETEGNETALICLSGSGAVRVNGDSFSLRQYDSIYIPRGASVEVTSDASADFIECSAPVEGDYPVQVVRYADVEKNSALKFSTGSEACRRSVIILIGKNVAAGRIIAGFTTSEPGNWTSWPPHEHAAMLEEIYVFYDMPAPAFGVQLVYTRPEEPEFVGVVREGDAVLLPAGFHPNLAVPGHRINFVWLMAAHRELEDRQFGVVNVQPGFDQKGTGLEASRK